MRIILCVENLLLSNKIIVSAISEHKKYIRILLNHLKQTIVNGSRMICLDQTLRSCKFLTTIDIIHGDVVPIMFMTLMNFTNLHYYTSIAILIHSKLLAGMELFLYLTCYYILPPPLFRIIIITLTFFFFFFFTAWDTFKRMNSLFGHTSTDFCFLLKY